MSEDCMPVLFHTAQPNFSTPSGPPKPLYSEFFPTLFFVLNEFELRFICIEMFNIKTKQNKNINI